MDLTKFKYKVGMPLAHFEGRYNFGSDNKSLSNRPDLCSRYGLAREVAALYKRRLKIIRLKINPGKGDMGKSGG